MCVYVQNNSEARPQKPVAAVFLFSEDKKAEYQQRFPQLSNSELRKLLVKEFNLLGDKEKVRPVHCVHARSALQA